MKKLLFIAALLLFLLPLVPQTVEVVTLETVSEEYIAYEPYTTYEKVKEPYRTIEQRVYWDDGGLGEYKRNIYFTAEESIAALQKVRPGRYITENVWVTKFKIVDKPVTKWREVTKTRETYQPKVEEMTEYISIINLIGRR